MKKVFVAALAAGILFTGYGVELPTVQESSKEIEFSFGAKHVQAAEVDLGMTYKQFADKFANTLNSMGNYSQYYIFNATLKTGPVKNVYQYNFHSNLSILATVSHSTGNIIEISLLVTPQSEAQILEMITLYGILMKTLNYGLSDAQMNQLLKQLYCHPDNISELINNNGKAIQGNIKYTTFFIESNGIFTLNASPKDL